MRKQILHFLLSKINLQKKIHDFREETGVVLRKKMEAPIFHMVLIMLSILLKTILLELLLINDKNMDGFGLND